MGKSMCLSTPALYGFSHSVYFIHLSSYKWYILQIAGLVFASTEPVVTFIEALGFFQTPLLLLCPTKAVTTGAVKLRKGSFQAGQQTL